MTTLLCFSSNFDLACSNSLRFDDEHDLEVSSRDIYVL